MKNWLGIDIGLSGARAAVVGSDGRLAGSGRVAIAAAAAQDGTFDPDRLVSAALEAARDALRDAGIEGVEAIGIGALGPCAIAIGEDCRPVVPGSLFAHDRRHLAWRDRLVADGVDGDMVGVDHSLPKLMRLRDEEPDRFARATWIVDMTGYAVARLTGLPVMDHVTRPDHEAPGIASPLALPAPRSALEIAGGLAPDAAEALGLRRGTPVATGSYDSYVDLYGAGIRHDGDAGILLGSTMVIGRIAGPGTTPDGLRRTLHIGEGEMLGGWTSCAGSLLGWARDFVGDVGACGDGTDRLPGSAGLVMLPYLAGERAPVWDADARGAIIGLTLHTRGADLMSAAREAVALSAADITTRIEGALGATEMYRAAGGGAAIPGLVEAVASATGAVIEVVDHPGEALGGAILAARALGVEVTRGVARSVAPRPDAAKRYAELHDIYRPLYGQLASAMHRLGRLARKEEAWATA
jgi:xylulokinase